MGGALSLLKIEGPRHRQDRHRRGAARRARRRGLHERLAVVSDDPVSSMCCAMAVLDPRGAFDPHASALKRRPRETSRRWRRAVELYADLKKYKRRPTKKAKLVLSSAFDALFTQRHVTRTSISCSGGLHNTKPSCVLGARAAGNPLHTNDSGARYP